MLQYEEHSLLASADNMDPIKQFVMQSLKAKSTGDTYFYDTMCKQLRDRDDAEMVWKVMIALSSAVTIIARSPEMYSELLSSILSYDWSCDRKISIAFVNLIGHLVSSNATFLVPTFNSLADSLIPTDSDLQQDGIFGYTLSTSEKDSNNSRSQRSTTENIAAAAAAEVVAASARGLTRSTSITGSVTPTLPPMPGFDPLQNVVPLMEAHTENFLARAYRIHRAIHSIIHLAPAGQAKLASVLVSKYPHKRFSKGILGSYIAQLLYICEYLPAIQQRILDTVMGNALELDVEIVIEDSGEVKIQEEYKGEDEEDLFQLDDVGGSSPAKSSFATAGGAKYETSSRIPDVVAEMADKLDAILALVVAHIDRQLQKDNLFKERFYQQMLSIFEERVLYTYRSKFVQFVYFYLGCKVERFATAFCQRLLRVFLETGHSSMKLQSAVLYLASFMARANFVPVGFVAENITGLVMWANEYISQVGADTPYSRSLAQPMTLSLTVGDLRSHSFDLANVSNTLNSSGSLEDLQKPQKHARGDKDPLVYAEFDEHGQRTSAAVQGTLSRHETFFCCMQAASYVLCFYGTELAVSIKEDESRRRQWERVMTSELNPLKYCLESVRGEFLRLAQRVELFSTECWRMLPSAAEYTTEDTEDDDQGIRSRSQSIIGAAVTSDSAGSGMHCVIGAVVSIPMEEPTPRTSDQRLPKKVCVPVMVSSPRTKVQVDTKGSKKEPNDSPGNHVPKKVPVMGTGNNPLESFFPFDPCLLQNMHQHVDAYYRTWRGVPGLDPGAAFDYDHDDGPFDGNSDDYDSDSDMQEQTGGHSFPNSAGHMERRDRGNTISSTASSLASQSDNQMALSITPGASGSRYSSYLVELAQGSGSAGTAFGSAGGASGHGSGVRHIRDGVSRHGSNISGTSGASSQGEDADNNSDNVWPMPNPRPRLYSVGSTGSW